MADPTAVLVANAPLEWTPLLAALAATAETLFGADGGANHLARLGLRPAWVIGDLDSIAPATRSWVGEDVLVHRPDQHRTDLDKAIEFAFDEIGVPHLTVLAATGGRIDHDLGNLGLLARLALGTRLIFEGDSHRLLAVRGELRLESTPGENWSFWTYDPETRVTVDGVRWPIDNAAIDAGGRPSLSNQATGEHLHISATGGSVVVFREMLTRDR